MRKHRCGDPGLGRDPAVTAMTRPIVPDNGRRRVSRVESGTRDNTYPLGRKWYCPPGEVNPSGPSATLAAAQLIYTWQDSGSSLASNSVFIAFLIALLSIHTFHLNLILLRKMQDAENQFSEDVESLEQIEQFVDGGVECNDTILSLTSGIVSICTTRKFSFTSRFLLPCLEQLDAHDAEQERGMNTVVVPRRWQR
ncbi:hypothetical protein B0H14DRAFT_3527080 [Mycena olivaceomarginata]|nr:hypothetical protein B0H14DRAFT_3527080 [Mycena olivaceomarginata]